MCRLELSRAASFQSSPEKVRWRINCLWLCVTRAVLRAEMTICWNIIGGKSSLPTLGSKSTLSLQCQRNHAHVCKRSDEGNRVSGCDDSRLVTDFVHDLGHPQLHMSIVRSSQSVVHTSSVSVATSCSGNRRKCFVSRARTCSEVNSSCSRCRWSRVEDEFETAAPAPRFLWLVAVVVQLQFDSCLEGSDAHNAQRVSPATPPRFWQAVKFHVFELEDSRRKAFLSYKRMQHANWPRVPVCWKGILRSEWYDWMQHYPQFQFLISDPGGCLVSNEL